MEALLAVVGNIWTEFTTFTTTATTTPIILLPLGFAVAGATVSLFRKATKMGGGRRR